MFTENNAIARKCRIVLMINFTMYWLKICFETRSQLISVAFEYEPNYTEKKNLVTRPWCMGVLVEFWNVEKLGITLETKWQLLSIIWPKIAWLWQLWICILKQWNSFFCTSAAFSVLPIYSRVVASSLATAKRLWIAPRLFLWWQFAGSCACYKMKRNVVRENVVSFGIYSP